MVERDFHNRLTAVEFTRKQKYIFLEEPQNENYSKVFQNIKCNLTRCINKNLFILTVVIDIFLNAKHITLVIMVQKVYSLVMHC